MYIIESTCAKTKQNKVTYMYLLYKMFKIHTKLITVAAASSEGLQKIWGGRDFLFVVYTLYSEIYFPCACEYFRQIRKVII